MKFESSHQKARSNRGRSTIVAESQLDFKILSSYDYQNREEVS